MEDAVQESLIAFWQEVAEIPADNREARRALLRCVARVALRARRHAQRRANRFVGNDEFDAPDPRDVEAWVEARILLLDALERLDEGTRALLVAHDLEGRSNAELAAELGEKEDTIEQRVIRGRTRLRVEIDRLLGKPKKKRKRARGALVLGLMGLDPMDRAVLRAVLDAEGHAFPLGVPPPPVSAVVPMVAGVSTILGPALGVVVALLGGLALLFVASSGPRGLPPDMGYAMRWGTTHELVTATRAALAAVSAAPRMYSCPNVHPDITRSTTARTPSRVVEPRREVAVVKPPPPVSSEELAERVAALRTVNVGRPPP
ncbi:sigma-70 family RNA polymerase sigma factor [Polyangium jinanense]|uniref:Sigma-70 family RNA polymerase sigma factor n=2 Tax=Polyangium jinanense TaxID=2829994 RepID=A0A9X4AXL5_9BACT|nr:sigma-70 family RNA polymerase sigma factor [Polyangium jinanense]